MNQHQTLTTATRQQILAEYDRGDDCNEIAARHGVSRSVVTMSAHRAGISRSNRTEVSPVRLIYGQWVGPQVLLDEREGPVTMTLLGAKGPFDNTARQADHLATVYPIRSQSQTQRDDEPDRDWLTSVELCVEVGITYRQVDHWTRTGLLTPVDGNTPGQGHWHRYPPDQVAKAKAVSALLKAGLYLPQIRKHIDQITSTGRLDIGPVTITYIPENTP